MPTTPAHRPAWQVVCPDHTTTPCANRAAAERLRDRIEQAGHCRLPHVVQEVPR